MKDQGRIIYRSEHHPDLQPKEDEGGEHAAPLSWTPPPKGLGDWVETWAKPIGCWLDRCTSRWPVRLRTKLCGCMTCSGRKARLNAWVPVMGAWEGGWSVAWRRLFGSQKDA